LPALRRRALASAWAGRGFLAAALPVSGRGSGPAGRSRRRRGLGLGLGLGKWGGLLVTDAGGESREGFVEAEKLLLDPGDQ
jgi:hypothetical protein